MAGTTANAITRPRGVDVALLAVAVSAIATSAPLIAATVVPPLAIAFWRSLLGSGLTAPWALARHRRELASLSGAELRGTVLGGVLLALHFAAWVPSLQFTTVAASTALVSLQPVWAALLARRRGAYIPRSAWTGIAIAFAGVLVLTGIDVSIDARHLIGDLLALVGGMLSAAYVTVGERVRRTVSTPAYTTVGYATSALVLLPLCLLLGQQLAGYPASGWATLVALTLGAQLLGHSLINVVLRTTSATVTSLAILLEMPGATLIAALWLGQVPPLALLPAVALIFAGLVLVIRAGDPRTPTETPPV
ncbi:MAG: EamA family transporter [Frankiales bacterium]|nr:EamA family transporter [Frankiales bacterium]